jgi:hypothetical protein
MNPDDPLDSPGLTPPARPDERVWTVRHGHVTWSCERHFRGERDGWEVQVLRNGDLFDWRGSSCGNSRRRGPRASGRSSRKAARDG